MLIKVFGNWINPKYVVALTEDEHSSITGLICIHFLNDKIVKVEAKTLVEVAKEINRQIADSNNSTTGYEQVASG